MGSVGAGGSVAANEASGADPTAGCASDRRADPSASRPVARTVARTVARRFASASVSVTVEAAVRRVADADDARAALTRAIMPCPEEGIGRPAKKSPPVAAGLVGGERRSRASLAIPTPIVGRARSRSTRDDVVAPAVDGLVAAERLAASSAREVEVEADVDVAEAAVAEVAGLALGARSRLGRPRCNRDDAVSCGEVGARVVAVVFSFDGAVLVPRSTSSAPYARRYASAMAASADMVGVKVDAGRRSGRSRAVDALRRGKRSGTKTGGGDGDGGCGYGDALELERRAPLRRSALVGRVGAGRRSRIADEAVGVATARGADAVAGRVARGVGESCLATTEDAGGAWRGGDGDGDEGEDPVSNPFPARRLTVVAPERVSPGAGRAGPGEGSVAVARGIRRTLNDDAGLDGAAEAARARCVGARAAPPASPNENSNSLGCTERVVVARTPA